MSNDTAPRTSLVTYADVVPGNTIVKGRDYLHVYAERTDERTGKRFLIILDSDLTTFEIDAPAILAVKIVVGD